MIQVTRFDAAPAYHPPGHHDMRCLRLQGHEAGETSALWMGVSHLLPGGGTTMDASPQEKLYVVLDGEVVVGSSDGDVVLRQWDSCRVPPGTPRALRNATNRPATILLAMPLKQAGVERGSL